MPGTASTELPGRVLSGRYLLHGAIGTGASGRVYVADDQRLRRKVAVKVLRPELCGHPEAERRFQREARINGLLQHPSIVPVHNLGRLADGRLYFTMKLVRGRTLADITALKMLPLEGIIVGKAIYEGTLKVADAVRELATHGA